MSHVFREVHPNEFEAAIKKAPQEKLDQERDYTGKRTFLNQDGTVGYALSNDGYWGNLFSLVRGGGSAASQDAINRGALYGNAFETKENNLVDYYRKFGLVPFAREANWTPGEPDVVHMKLPHAPVPAHIQKKIDSGEARLESGMTKSEIINGIMGVLSKKKASAGHPHAYEWHDGHTTHHGSLGKADDDAEKGFEHKTNEQVATVGVPTYRKYAEKYGTIDKSAPPVGSSYDYRSHGKAVDELAKRYGYQVYFAGGKYGKPDLANKNYDTGWLMVYDPSPDSGNDFGDEQQTRNYRIVHELAHALTRKELNETPVHGFEGEVYGERPRMGRLGAQRPLRDAMRAVYWEHLAANKQRELTKEIGLELSEPEFAKEYNTVMHDAAHRAVTGRFTEPSKEGFQPHDKIVPLEVSMKLVTDAAKEKGLKGLDDVAPKVAKSEDLLTKTEQLLSLLNEDLDKGEKKYSKKVTNPDTGREKTVKYGAKGYTIAPGTSRGDSYCARSYGQMKDHPGAAKDPNSPLRLSRAKWRCSGKYSRKFEEEFGEILDKAEELQDRLECMIKAEELASAIEAIISSDVELDETQIERVKKSEALLKRIVG